MKPSYSASGPTAVLQRSVLTALALILTLPIYSIDYDATGATTEQAVQLRTGAEFTKKWKNGLQLSLSEELRFDLYDHQTGVTAKTVPLDTNLGAAFNKSYTTLSFAYTPVEYFKMDAGYTLRILGRKAGSEPNKFIRHRVFFGVTGAYRVDFVKLYLRERFLCEMRTDSVNLLEKNKYNWLLRSRVGADFTVPGKPVKPYLWAELENSLNAPEYQRQNGRQFITHIRAQAGVKWRVSRLSSLDFYYRFQYGYDRDINITKNKSLIQLTEETVYLHAIGINYHLDW